MLVDAQQTVVGKQEYERSDGRTGFRLLRELNEHCEARKGGASRQIVPERGLLAKRGQRATAFRGNAG